MHKYEFSTFENEQELKEIIELIEQDLSEPYSIYTFRYFVYSFPSLTIMIHCDKQLVGAVIGRVDERAERKRGYIAMLAVKKEYRKKNLGSELVERILDQFEILKVDEVSLEAEIDNIGALKLYQKLGFVKDKRLDGYYMNGADAFRLKLYRR